MNCFERRRTEANQYGLKIRVESKKYSSSRLNKRCKNYRQSMVMIWKRGNGGANHKVQFYHPLSDVNPVLAYVFNREKPISVGGSSVTPMAASYDNETGEVDHGASWRFVIDMAEAD